MKNLKRTQEQLPYSKTVQKAYFLVLRQAKQLLASLEQDVLRFTLERRDPINVTGSYIVHELVNPLLYLRLETNVNNVMEIHFGFEQMQGYPQLSDLTAKVLRLLVKYTSKAVTGINIEQSLKTDWFITNCSEMYEYIEERNRHHTFKLIEHKVTNARRKQLLYVA